MNKDQPIHIIKLEQIIKEYKIKYNVLCIIKQDEMLFYEVQIYFDS